MPQPTRKPISTKATNRDMINSINNIETIDLTGSDGNITLALDSDDIVKLTDRDANYQLFEDTKDDESNKSI
jgi:hypothetical protein